MKTIFTAYQKQIKQLKNEILYLDSIITQKDCQINHLEHELRQKCEWIKRIMEYNKMSKDDIENIIEAEKASNELLDML